MSRTPAPTILSSGRFLRLMLPNIRRARGLRMPAFAVCTLALLAVVPRPALAQALPVLAAPCQQAQTNSAHCGAIRSSAMIGTALGAVCGLRRTATSSSSILRANASISLFPAGFAQAGRSRRRCAGSGSASRRTPVGVFRVVGKIGAGQPDDEIIKGERRPGRSRVWSARPTTRKRATRLSAVF